MRGPVGVITHRGLRARVNRTLRHLDHGDAALHRADVDAQVAGHAFIILHREHPAGAHVDGLMAGILAGGIAAAAFDAGVLIDLRLGHIVQVQELPIRAIPLQQPW